MSSVSDIKLKRTDITHDLSQKAEKRYRNNNANAVNIKQQYAKILEFEIIFTSYRNGNVFKLRVEICNRNISKCYISFAFFCIFR